MYRLILLSIIIIVALLLGFFKFGSVFRPNDAYRVDFKHLHWDLRQTRNVNAVAWPADWKDYICTWQRIERLDLTLPDGRAFAFDNCQAWVSRRGDSVVNVSVHQIIGPIEAAATRVRSVMWQSGVDTAGLEEWLTGMQNIQPERMRQFKPEFTAISPNAWQHFSVKNAGEGNGGLTWVAKFAFRLE